MNVHFALVYCDYTEKQALISVLPILIKEIRHV